MSKRVIVFGGSGFLGSHVADVLTGAGFDVAIFDRAGSPYKKAGQEMIVGDILDEDVVFEAIKGRDIVYNFAAIADIDEASQRPMESVKTNILGNMAILEACRKANVKRFVYASSLYVYSKQASFYRSTKQACESLVENYKEIFNLPYTILRYGSIYGPRSDEKNFINRILNQALREKKITREGDGEEIREYIHAIDAAKGSVEILSEEFANQHVVIAGNQQMKVKDLLLMIKEMMDNKVEIEYRPALKNSHYEITPYVFAPKVAKKLVSRTYLDLGQGILDSIQDIYNKLSLVSQ
ncbi:NAD-dependent epimerase/dehydratase family protein [Candidatus Omnitrophota bacterium]